MPDNIIEKYLDYDGLKTYDSNIKEVLQKDITESAWQPSHAYVEDDYVVYNGLLYQCTNAHTSGTPTTPAEWEASEASYWQQIHILDDEIIPLKTTVNTIAPLANSAIQSVSGTTNHIDATTSNKAVTIDLANNYGDYKNPYASKTKNYVLAAPAAANGAPSFRALVSDDIPNIPASKITSGTLDTGRIPDLSATYIPKSIITAAGDLIVGSGNGQVTTLSKGANGKFLTISNGSVVWGDTTSANDATITIQKNGTDVGSFTLNQSSDGTINITDVASAATLSGIVTRVTNIEGKIPDDASSSNKLADKTWVNDQINAMAAYYITKNAAGDAFDDYEELHTLTTVYSGGSVRVPTRNDYAIVLADENHDNATTRYSYQFDGDTYDPDYWQYQYTVNESPFTQDQLAAINSGITEAKVTTYDGYATGKQDTLVSGTNIKTISTNNATAQTATASESLLGSGTINLHKVSKTGNYNDLLNKPTIPTSFNITANATDGIFDITGTGGANSVTYSLAPYSSSTATESWVGNSSNAGKFYLGNQDPVQMTRLNYNGLLAVDMLRAVDGIAIPQIDAMGDVSVGLNQVGLTFGSGLDSVSFKFDGIEKVKVVGSTTNQYNYSLPDATGTIALEENLPEVEFSTDPYDTPTATIKGMKVGDDEYNFFIPDSIAAATTSVLGSVKLGTASAGSATKTYPVGFNASQQMYVDVPWTDTATAADNIFDGSNSGTQITYAPYSSTTATSTWVNNDTNAGKFYLGTQNPSKTTRLNYNGYLYAKNLYDNGSRVVNLADAQTLTGVKTWNVSSGTTAGVIVKNSAWSTPGSSQSGLTPTGIQITYGLNNYNLSFPTTKGGTFALTNDIPYVNMTYTAGTSGSANTTTWSYRAAGATGDPLTVTFNNITTAEINTLFN